MNYASVCSGIEAPSVAWQELGWTPRWFSEVDGFANAVLAHHWPSVPNLGDMETIFDKEAFRDESVDLIVGGTPCQSFSVAGLRGGLDDPRGNLALVYLAAIEQLRPRWVIWENVPGVLSADRGRAFGAFLGGLEELGYGWAYRTLDAQFFGVAQRRRRVFVVGFLGDWRSAAAVLFEPESLRGNPAPRAPNRAFGARCAQREIRRLSENFPTGLAPCAGPCRQPDWSRRLVRLQARDRRPSCLLDYSKYCLYPHSLSPLPSSISGMLERCAQYAAWPPDQRRSIPMMPMGFLSSTSGRS